MLLFSDKNQLLSLRICRLKENTDQNTKQLSKQTTTTLYHARHNDHHYDGV